MTQDIAGQTRRLFSSTTKLLGLDEAKLSVAEKIRVDRASTLRLLLDDMQSAQLNGGAIDVGQFIKASEELERLAGGNPEASATHDFTGAREELQQFFAERAERLQMREQRESAKLREENAELREQIARLQSQQPSNAVPPQKQSTTNNVVPIAAAKPHDANSTKPPAGYLKQYEPWESSGGALCAPPWTPPDDYRR